MKTFIVSVCLLVLSVSLSAQKKAVFTADFSAPEASQNVHGTAQIERHGKQSVLVLGERDGYYDLTAEAGRVVSGLDDFTITVWYKVGSENRLDGNGHFLFAFSSLAENQANAGPYVAMRLNQQRFETSTGGWDHEEIVMTGHKAPTDEWTLVVFRQTGKTGQLFLNGQLVGTNERMPILSQNFTDSPAYCWIGKAPFRGDKYLTNTQVADFRIYGRALSDKEMQKMLRQKPE